MHEKTLAETIKTEVSYILYTEAAIVSAVFLAMVVYYPDSPPSPPSLSATTKRQDFLKGIRHILTKPKNIITGKKNFLNFPAESFYLFFAQASPLPPSQFR